MKELRDLYQSADWKSEKHVPVIDAPEEAGKGQFFPIKVTLGKEVAHPNETKHHIRWIEIYFHPEGAKYPFQIARAEFSAHGESPDGPDTSGVYTHHEASVQFKTDNPGVIYAASYCNIHGLWQNAKRIAIKG